MRQVICRTCGTKFETESGSRRRYCSKCHAAYKAHRQWAARGRRPSGAPLATLGEVIAHKHKNEL
jgi:protein-arginine kinase activator protein McsA